jgi:GntR family transcriptional repressor for pyruvate dehydrogenase complex
MDKKILEPIKTEKLYDIIVRRISDLINEEKLEPGDRLPSERELAAALAVSRASVRQAIAALSAKGVVVMRQGDGTYVSNQEGHTLELFGKFLAGSQINPDEILEVRIMVECESAKLCALRADDDYLRSLRDILCRQKKYKPVKGESNTFNRELHTAIALGAKNKALMRIVDVVWDIMSGNMWPLLKRETSQESGQIELHWKQHQKIVDAICGHNAERASKAMYEHLITIKKDMDNLINKYQH